MYHVVHDPNGPDLEFAGTRLVETDHMDLGKVEVFRTEAGSFVVKQFRAALYGRTGIDRVGVFENLDAVRDWIGNTAGAKKLMELLGQPNRRQLE